MVSDLSYTGNWVTRVRSSCSPWVVIISRSF